MGASGWCADANAVAHLFVPDLDDELIVAGADGHHLQRVRRLHAGEAVTAADPHARWRRYHIVDARDGRLTLVATGPHTEEPTLHPGLRVAFAPTKGHHPDLVVRQCSELGVDAVVPVVAARSVVRWDHRDRPPPRPAPTASPDESAVQCHRARLLTVEGARPPHPPRRRPRPRRRRPDRAGPPTGSPSRPAGPGSSSSAPKAASTPPSSTTLRTGAPPGHRTPCPAGRDRRRPPVPPPSPAAATPAQSTTLSDGSGPPLITSSVTGQPLGGVGARARLGSTS